MDISTSSKVQTLSGYRVRSSVVLLDRIVFSLSNWWCINSEVKQNNHLYKY